MDVFVSDFHPRRETGPTAIDCLLARGEVWWAWGQGLRRRVEDDEGPHGVRFLGFLNLSFTLDIFMGPFNPRM